MGSREGFDHPPGPGLPDRVDERGGRRVHCRPGNGHGSHSQSGTVAVGLFPAATFEHYKAKNQAERRCAQSGITGKETKGIMTFWDWLNGLPLRPVPQLSIESLRLLSSSRAAWNLVVVPVVVRLSASMLAWADIRRLRFSTGTLILLTCP